MSDKPFIPLDLLLPYQQRFVRDASRFKLAVQSRQTGKSLGTAYESVEDCLSDPGTSWVCLSAGERQALEWMEKAREWSEIFKMALEDYAEDRDSGEALLKSAEVRFATGSRIIAIPANPSTARGYSANIVLDEFAYHEAPDKIWAAMFPSVSNPLAGTLKNKWRAMTSGQGSDTIRRALKIRVVSTFNGRGNKFFDLWDRREKLGFSGHRVTIHDAIADGLPLDAEELRKALDNDEIWAQEYLCEPMDTSDVLLPYDLIATAESAEATEHWQAPESRGDERSHRLLAGRTGRRRALDSRGSGAQKSFYSGSTEPARRQAAPVRAIRLHRPRHRYGRSSGARLRRLQAVRPRVRQNRSGHIHRRREASAFPASAQIVRGSRQHPRADQPRSARGSPRHAPGQQKRRVQLRGAPHSRGPLRPLHGRRPVRARRRRFQLRQRGGRRRMKLLSRIRNIARISRMDSADVARAWEARNLDGAAPEATGADRPGQTVTTAFACIVARREAIAARPPIVSDAADNVVESGPLAELVERPNAAMDGAEFRRVLETHQTLHNACAIHIEPDSVRPELEPLHPAGLKAVRGVYGPAGTPRAIAWQYRDPYTREQREFAPEDVVVRRGYSPYDPWGALSPTVALRETIVSELSARQQNASTFRNAATPRGYLHSDQGMTREQAMQALDVWNGAYQGHLNAAKTAAVWGGLKYEQLQLTPAELDFINTFASTTTWPSASIPPCSPR